MPGRSGLALALGLAMFLGGVIVSCLTPAISSAQTDFSIPSMAPPPPNRHSDTEADKRLRERILQDDAKKNTEDAAKLLAMALDLQDQVAKGNTQLISVSAAKDTKEIEKLARGIRGRLNRNFREIRF